METQTMTMEYTEGGAEITMTIHIDQNQDLMSMSIETENGSATSSITYEVMWGDAIVIEVDETLPKTSIPVWIRFRKVRMNLSVDQGRQSRWIGSTMDTLIVKMAPMSLTRDGLLDVRRLHATDADQDTCYSWMYLEDYDSPRWVTSHSLAVTMMILTYSVRGNDE